MRRLIGSIVLVIARLLRPDVVRFLTEVVILIQIFIVIQWR